MNPIDRWLKLMRSTQPGISRRRYWFFHSLNNSIWKPFIATESKYYSFWNAVYALAPVVANWVDIENEYDGETEYGE